MSYTFHSREVNHQLNHHGEPSDRHFAKLFKRAQIQRAISTGMEAHEQEYLELGEPVGDFVGQFIYGLLFKQLLALGVDEHVLKC